MDDMASDTVNLLTQGGLQKKKESKRGPMSVDNPMYGSVS